MEVMPAYYVPPSSGFNRTTHKKDKPFYSTANANKYIDAFMKTDATHMWMVDADQEPPPHALCELLKLDVDLASGVSFGHGNPKVTTALKWFPKPRPKAPRSRAFYKFLKPPEIFGKIVKSPDKLTTGAFCFVAKRRVFEKHHPKMGPLRFRWNPPQKYGPDLTFWMDAQTWGFTTAIHGGVICGHLPEHSLKLLADFEWV